MANKWCVRIQYLRNACKATQLDMVNLEASAAVFSQLWRDFVEYVYFQEMQLQIHE